MLAVEQPKRATSGERERVTTAHPVPAELPRPRLVERATYVPNAPCEEFIVPLLSAHVARSLGEFASPAPVLARALDCGCGRQPFRAALEAIGYSYTGTDVAQNPEGSVDVTCAIDGPLPRALLERGPFDFVLCTEVLEHVAGWDVAFANFSALLKPGGRVLVTAPHFYQLHEEPYDFWRPTLNAIDLFAARSGLRVIHRQKVGDGWDVLGTLLGSVHPFPRSRRLLDRVYAKVARIAQRAIFRWLRSQTIQRRLHIGSPLYLSNLAVLEKPNA